MEYKLSRTGRVFNAMASKPNPNENGFPAHLVRQAAPFPPQGVVGGTLISTRADQLTVGCCTGEGSTRMGNRLYRTYGPTLKIPVRAEDVPDFDPLFTYYLERQKEGTLEQGDCGAQVVTSLEVADMNPGAAGFGWCPASRPFDVRNVNVAPTPAQLAAAKLWPGGAFHNLGNSIANIKSSILSKPFGYTGVVGINVYESFEDDTTAASGLIPYPNLEREQQVGGHEMHSYIAYDDTVHCPNSPNPGAVLTENSWGPYWGADPGKFQVAKGRGFCWLSYDYLANPNLASDNRMAHLGRAW